MHILTYWRDDTGIVHVAIASKDIPRDHHVKWMCDAPSELWMADEVEWKAKPCRECGDALRELHRDIAVAWPGRQQ